MREDDGAIDTMAFEHREGRIVAIYVVRNPEKLRHVPFDTCSTPRERRTR
jgi:hypothetical protein